MFRLCDVLLKHCKKTYLLCKLRYIYKSVDIEDYEKFMKITRQSKCNKKSILQFTFILGYLRVCQVREVREKSGNSLYPLKSQGKVGEFREKSGKSQGISVKSRSLF